MQRHAEHVGGHAAVHGNLAVVVAQVGGGVQPRVHAPGRAAKNSEQQDEHQRHGQLRFARHLLAALLGEARDIGHDDGDVVVAAGGDCLVDQLRCATLRVAHAAHGGFDLLVANHGRQAVRAHQQPVAGFHVDLVHVGARVRVAAKRARNDGALRMVARLFGRELAGFDHVGHQTVVARELLEFPLVKQVGA